MPDPYSEAELKAVARRFAPIVYQEIDGGTRRDPPRFREDFIAAVDYDGNLRADDNWENVDHFPLKPVIYFAYVETRTHRFIAYAVYHPRDWSRTPIPYAQHENDMENIQVIVEKARDRVILLMTQAHILSLWSKADGSGAEWKEKGVYNGPLITFDDDIRTDPEGSHAGVFIESAGHGIYPLGCDAMVDAAVDDRRIVAIRRRKLPLLPLWVSQPVVEYVPAASDDIELHEPTSQPLPGDAQTLERNVPYGLESTYHRFWLEIEKGNLCGDGKLFDGSFAYEDSLCRFNRVPRYFDSDFKSGPGKTDAGIAPFALGHSLADPELGGFFFNPAYSYRRWFTFPEPFSDEYVYNPYLESPLNEKR